MLPFGVTIPTTVPQGSEIPEGLTNNPVYIYIYIYIFVCVYLTCFNYQSDIPDAVSVQFLPPEDEHSIARNMSRYLM
jgi:hypothetical protein